MRLLSALTMIVILQAFITSVLACTTDQDCKDGRVCTNHQCAAAPPKVTAKKCQKDVDCPGEEVCEANQCRIPGSSTPQASSKHPIEITGKDGAPMRLVPAGKFIMGSKQDSEGEEREVDLKDYYMDVYEVTEERFGRFLQESKWRESPDVNWNAGALKVLSKEEHKARLKKQLPWSGAGPADAKAYCRFYGKRLPTDQEWENAARGTDGRDYPWGDEDPTSEHANFKVSDSMQSALKPVGSFKKGISPYGMYDMAGNVAEVVMSTGPRDSEEPEDGRIFLRGGSKDDTKEELLVWKHKWWPWAWWTMRGVSPYDQMYKEIVPGFRCAADPPK